MPIKCSKCKRNQKKNAYTSEQEHLWSRNGATFSLNLFKEDHQSRFESTLKVFQLSTLMNQQLSDYQIIQWWNEVWSSSNP